MPSLYINKNQYPGLDTKAYLYRWTHVDTGMWYIGSRAAYGCHPDDGYICSSKTVLPMINEHPENWKREVLVIGNALYIRDLEARYLNELDAKHDRMSYNMHNGDGNFTTAGRKEDPAMTAHRTALLTGRKKPEGFAEKISKIHKGKIVSAQARLNIGAARKGLHAGDKNPGHKGYYYSPTGERYVTAVEAAAAVGLHRLTVMRWAREELHGWSRKPE